MRRPVATTVVVGLAATAIFYVMVHVLGSMWLDLTVRREIRTAIEKSLEAHRRLGDADPARATEYRQEFERQQALLNRLDVLAMSQRHVLRRFEMILVGIFVISFMLASIVWWRRQKAAEWRARDEYGERLRGWQEASRRHAHEIRTPLTAARMELERLVSAANEGDRASVEQVGASVNEELDRIAAFTREFSSFALLAQPVLSPHRVREMIEEFCRMFDRAWPVLRLEVGDVPESLEVMCDRDLLRQVLVNLATNSARAAAPEGSLTFSALRRGDFVWIDVEDTGRGVPEGIRQRIFEPYVTSAPVGEGMGLGLSISRKILLDHGGDLRLVRTSEHGTVMRLILQAAE